MNNYIRELHDAMGYDVRDQTIQGSSNTGEQAGEEI